MTSVRLHYTSANIFRENIMMEIMFLSLLTLNIGTYSFSFKIDENLFNFNIFVFGGGGNPWSHKHNFFASPSFFLFFSWEAWKVNFRGKNWKTPCYFHFDLYLIELYNGFMIFLLVVFHIIVSCCALRVKELMLQFCGLPVFPGT